MELNDLKPARGATKGRSRVGRGPGSGKGKTAGRGHKGQKSRSGYSRRFGFEGGQMPLARRIPKRGFFNRTRIDYQVVNLRDLERVFDSGDNASIETMARKGLVDIGSKPVKILATGQLTKKLTVQAHKFSNAAQTSIEKAGGACEVVAL